MAVGMAVAVAVSMAIMAEAVVHLMLEQSVGHGIIAAVYPQELLWQPVVLVVIILILEILKGVD
jgi:hypothetical protein